MVFILVLNSLSHPVEYPHIPVYDHRDHLWQMDRSMDLHHQDHLCRNHKDLLYWDNVPLDLVVYHNQYLQALPVVRIQGHYRSLEV